MLGRTFCLLSHFSHDLRRDSLSVSPSSLHFSNTFYLYITFPNFRTSSMHSLVYIMFINM